ncbi:MAG: hypothetical protein LBC41_08735 [Clostridiales bacterium]|nr:hypothetical protein [Clostridiales bacterium]
MFNLLEHPGDAINGNEAVMFFCCENLSQEFDKELMQTDKSYADSHYPLLDFLLFIRETAVENASAYEPPDPSADSEACEYTFEGVRPEDRKEALIAAKEGFCHMHGIGCPVNVEIAAEKYQISADLGLPLAQYELAGLLASGCGVEKDLAAAASFYDVCSDVITEAKYRLALMHLLGLGVDDCNAGNAMIDALSRSGHRKSIYFKALYAKYDFAPSYMVYKDGLKPIRGLISSMIPSGMDIKNAAKDFVEFATIKECTHTASVGKYLFLSAMLEFLRFESPKEETNIFMLVELIEAASGGKGQSDLDVIMSSFSETYPDHLAVEQYNDFYALFGVFAGEITQSLRRDFPFIGKSSDIFAFFRNKYDAPKLAHSIGLGPILLNSMPDGAAKEILDDLESVIASERSKEKKLKVTYVSLLANSKYLKVDRHIHKVAMFYGKYGDNIYSKNDLEFLTRYKSYKRDASLNYDKAENYMHGKNKFPQDYALSFTYALRGALGGNSNAQFRLGYLYSRGLGTPCDINESLHWYKIAADNNSQTACYNLGIHYAYGSAHTPVDPELALYYYKKSADLGNGNANLDIGKIYEFGTGVSKDIQKASEYYSKARTYYQKAYKNGTASGYDLYRYGYMYESGYGAQKNLAMAAQIYEAGVKKGENGCMVNLASFYESGSGGLAVDYSKAFALYTESAKSNYKEGYYGLGNLHYYGRGVPQDKAKAAQEYEMAAKLGHRNATKKLAEMNLTGDGIPQNVAKALQLYEPSIKTENPECLHDLALWHLNGTGVEKDANKAVELLQIAARHNYVPSLEKLGKIHFYGTDGFDVNYGEAFLVFDKAEKLGSTECQFWLGYLYHTGHGVMADHEKALSYYLLSGSSASFYNIGIMYRDGKLGDPNPEKASEYILKSVSMGNAYAHAALAGLYEKGIHFEKDMDKAIEWYKKGAKLGNDSSIKWLKEHGLSIED